MYSHCLNIFFTNSNNNVTQRLVWSRHCITLQLINSLLKNTITGHSWRLLTFGTLTRTHDLTSQKTMTETRPFRTKTWKASPFLPFPVTVYFPYVPPREIFSTHLELASLIKCQISCFIRFSSISNHGSVVGRCVWQTPPVTNGWDKVFKSKHLED